MKSKSLKLAAIATLGLVSVLVGPQVYGASGNGVGTEANNIGQGVVGEGFEATDTTPAKAEVLGEFDIAPGRLTLDKVPNFHFKKNATDDPTVYDLTKNTELTLVDATVTNGKDYDGSKSLEMIVSDFRGDEKAGWKVYGNVTPFKMDDQHVLKGTTLKVKAKLAATRSNPDDGVDVDAPDLVSLPATEDTGIVLQALPKKGTLTNKFIFDGDTKLSFSAQAVTKGNYQSKITWSLANVPAIGD